MLLSTALLLDSIIRNSVCTPAKLPCRRVEVGYKKINNINNECFIFHGKTHFTTYSVIIVAYNYRKRRQTFPKSKTFFQG
jgi:hypothetical protein